MPDIKQRTKIVSVAIIVIALLFSMQLEGKALLYETSYQSGFFPTVNVSYYPVDGNNAAQLKSSMFERGPIGYGSKRFFAYTLWSIKYMPNESRHLKCYISVHLPRLRPSAERPLKLSHAWNGFYQSMIAHEKRHVKYAARACRLLKSKPINEARLQSSAGRIKMRDKKFDEVTQHGILEGVRL